MDGGSSSRGGEEWPKKMNKKGMWTPQEDETLTEYVRKHGEGNWNAVQRRTPLLRSGKSCRLRWTNHLRPDLKKGAFSPEEESLVVQLHAKYGNRWAHMATLMPGRTDNEIKNFWNTRMKRIRKAYLPIYPRRFRRARIIESSPSNPSLTVGNAQPPPPFFGALSSQWNLPESDQCQLHQLPPQSTIAGLRRNLSTFCAESHLQSKRASVVLPSIQITSLGAMVPSSGGFFPTPSKESMSGLLGNLLGESETLAQKEMEKNKRESLGGDGAEAAGSSSFGGEPIKEPINEIERTDDGLSGALLAESETLALKEIEKYLSESLSDYHAEAAYQATSSSFSGAPTEELIDEIECMDDGLLVNLLAEFETLVPKEMEKNHSENLSGHHAEATYQATSTSSIEYRQFSGGEPTEEPIDEIDCMDNAVLGNLFAKSKALALKEMKKNQSDSWSAYHVEVADQATSSSFNEHKQFSGEEPIEEPINEIECMDDSLLGDLLAECETLALKEKESNQSKSLSGYCAKAVDQATSSPFSEHTQFSGSEPIEESIVEIECMDNGWWGDLLAEPKTLALKEMEKNNSESLSGYPVEVANQATSFSFSEYTQFSGAKPTEEPIAEIKCMDNGWLGDLLAEPKTLALKEMEKNKSESLSGYPIEVANQATSFSFSKYTQFSGAKPTEEPIVEIECTNNGWLGDLLAEPKTLALKEMEKSNSESLSGYPVEVTNQATSFSFSEYTQFSGAKPTEERIAEIECMDNGWLRDLLTEPETLALKEMEKNKSESLSGYPIEVANQATPFSFSAKPTELIAEIECVNNDLSGLLSSFASTMPSSD